LKTALELGRDTVRETLLLPGILPIIPSKPTNAIRRYRDHNHVATA
jgi:hypothetical protein